MVIGFSGHREAVLRHAQVIASRNTRWSLQEDWQADSGATPPHAIMKPCSGRGELGWKPLESRFCPLD